MRAWPTFLVLGGLAFYFATANAPAASPARSTSTSRQFIVYGGNVALRGEICSLAEQTKASLLQRLALRDNWKTPILINLTFPRANLPEVSAGGLEFSQLGYGLKLQLNLPVTEPAQNAARQRELLRAIFVEMIYRGRSDVAAGTPYVTPPDWLVDGLLAEPDGSDAGADAEILRSLVAAQKIAPLEQVVQEQRGRLDAPSQRVHDAYSRALVQLLLQAPDGRAKLVRFINQLPDAPNDGLADLRAHFPETLGQAPSKWWALSVAQLSASDRYEILSAAETAAQLDRILPVSLPDADGTTRLFSLGEYTAFRRRPGAAAALQKLGQELLLLGTRSHPSYRPIIQELHELVELLGRGQARRLAERLERVASYRAVVEQQSREVDDYLNWYEATQSKTMSGAFSELLDPARAARSLPRRRDPISVYLDSVEVETD